MDGEDETDFAIPSEREASQHVSAARINTGKTRA